LCFEIGQHSDSLFTLEALKAFFGCGNIHLNSRDGVYHYTVKNLSNLSDSIIPHFLKYPLKTVKANSFAIFCQICTKLHNGDHFNYKGLKDILELGYIMNPSGTRKYTKEF